MKKKQMIRTNATNSKAVTNDHTTESTIKNCVETIQPHISTVSSSQEAWERLLVLFANKSRSRVMSLKERLFHNPRGTRSIPEYLQHMRAIADDLALIDNPLSEDDLVLYTIGGLGPEFKEIAAAIRARDTSISFDELYDKLGDYELHLKKEDPIPSLSIATANYTHRSNRFTPRNSSINGSASAGRHSNHFHPRNTDHSPSHPNSNQNNWSSSNTQHRIATPRSSLYCRFCDRPRHATNECRKLARFLRENDVQTVHSVQLYVDDIILTGNDIEFLDSFVKNLDLRFSLKDLGPLHHFLGVEVIPTPGGLFLSQHRHINDLLNNFSMTGAKEVNTPMCTSSALTLHDGSSHVDPTPYRKLVGALQYLSLTRPHTTLKHVLRYLKATIHHGLYLRRGTPLTLQAFSDSDWGGDRDNGRSTTGYILYLGTNPISWKSTRQKSVSRSSSEAEYKAIANSTAETLWVTNHLHELGITLPQPPTLFCDNTGATYLCANPIFHSRMKHIALDYHFVRECVTNDSLRVHHINTKDQLADILTKALNRQQFLHLRAKIGVTNGASILRGRELTCVCLKTVLEAARYVLSTVTEFNRRSPLQQEKVLNLLNIPLPQETKPEKFVEDTLDQLHHVLYYYLPPNLPRINPYNVVVGRRIPLRDERQSRIYVSKLKI
ncbi:hypothetical protein RJ640_022253 [Escallonia rubra]|uniref:Reverse transcriptase Ty1/copia-type domain-containing protein n=1 Tax=Escallonia rubra TaxID=112253 RepID=A0AA88RWQ2_9ASTE|nr:hypothetical protein RJ640_022253 [Escallonia rubra]